MDLGFGDNNQKVGDVAAQALIQTVKAHENKIDDELAQYDQLLDDDRALERLRASRLSQLKQAQQLRQQWQAAGHGAYQELGQGRTNDVAKEFFIVIKNSETMVVHFYRPSSRMCDVFHRHLTDLATQHLETKFVKINVQDLDHAQITTSSSQTGLAFLVERLGIVVMPTIVVIKNRQAVHHIRGFDELEGKENCSREELADLLALHGGINLGD